MLEEDRIVKLEERVRMLELEILNLKTADKIDIPQQTKGGPLPLKKTNNSKDFDFEKEIGQKWLPRIFIFVLLLGVIWGFKAGTEMGLLNEYVRIGLGYLFGVSLLVIGHKQLNKKHFVLGNIQIGGAVAILFVTTFAAHILYQFLSFWGAFSIHIIIVLLGYLLTKFYRSQSVGIVCSIGAFLVPFLLQSENGNLLFLGLYELTIWIAFMSVALIYQFKSLYVMVTYGLHISFFIVILIYWNIDHHITIASIVQHLIIILYFLYKDTLKKQVAFTVVTTAVLTSIWLLTTITNSFWLLFFPLSYILIAAYFKLDPIKHAVLLSSAALMLVLFFLDTFEQSTLGLFLIIEGSIFIYLAYRIQSNLQKWIGFGIYVLGVLPILIHPIEQLFSIEALAWTILIASFLFHYRINTGFKEKRDAAGITKVFINIAGLLYISQLSILLTPYLETMVLSITWIIYSAANILFGHVKKDKLFRLFGICLILITLLKVIFVDLPTVSILVRAILFLLLGLMGLTVSRLFYKKEKD